MFGSHNCPITPLARKMSATVFVAALLAVAPSARANTYLFSFTAQDVINALPLAQQANYGYFALFMQPMNAGTFTFLDPTYKDLSAPATWDASVADYSNLVAAGMDGTQFPGTQVLQFSRPLNSTMMTLISATHIFVTTPNTTYWDDGTQPVSVGALNSPPNSPNEVAITSILSPGAKFSFSIDTGEDLSGGILVAGLASAITSDLATKLQDPKTSVNNGFYLELQPVPEPGSVSLVLLGLTCLVAAARRARTHAS